MFSIFRKNTSLLLTILFRCVCFAVYLKQSCHNEMSLFILLIRLVLGYSFLSNYTGFQYTSKILYLNFQHTPAISHMILQK